jgi:hypothetical protein
MSNEAMHIGARTPWCALPPKAIHAANTHQPGHINPTHTHHSTWSHRHTSSYTCHPTHGASYTHGPCTHAANAHTQRPRKHTTPTHTHTTHTHQDKGIAPARSPWRAHLRPDGRVQVWRHVGQKGEVHRQVPRDERQPTGEECTRKPQLVPATGWGDSKGKEPDGPCKEKEVEGPSTVTSTP